MRSSTSWWRRCRCDNEPASRCTTGWSTSPGSLRGGASNAVEPSRHRSSTTCDWRSRERYAEPFDSIGFNLYRDGDDSVAWHGDRHRHVVTNPVIAIVSTGAPRPLRLRRRRDQGGGGPSRSWSLGNGDLFVMGGACQHDWEHAVPKVRSVTGPRLSITFRSV